MINAIPHAPVALPGYNGNRMVDCFAAVWFHNDNVEIARTGFTSTYPT